MDGYGGSAGKRSSYDDDVGERNGRQKRRPSSASDGANQAEETEYRILCPVTKIGSLIGKAGSAIKTLRAECQCKIKVEDPVPGSDERVVLIVSSADHSREEQSGYVCAAQEALFRVHARIAEAEDDDEDEPPQPVCVRLLVPKQHIGCLLGKGGKIIEQMRKEIGAQIRILPKEQHPLCAGSTDELVQVTGDASLVKKALFEISSRLHEDITGVRTHKSSYASQGPGGNMMAVMFGGSGGMYPAMGYVQAGSLLGPTSVGDHVQGLGYSYGGMYGDVSTGKSWGLSMPSSASGAFPHSDGATEEEFAIRVLCPSIRIGSIIGKGGNVIKKMREDTGTNIKVEDQLSDCDERVVLISAFEFVDAYPSPVIQATMQVFRRLVEMQMEKETDRKSLIVRLLVPSTQIGCLLGKGGSIVSEMRKNTKATIKISPKDEPSKCAKENDELVQVMGDQNVVQDALFQIISRLRGNVFKGQEGTDRDSGFGSSMLPMTGAMYAGTNMMNSYRGGLDPSAAGAMYPFANVGYYGMDYGYGGVGSQTSFGRDRESKDSRRRQR